MAPLWPSCPREPCTQESSSSTEQECQLDYPTFKCLIMYIVDQISAMQMHVARVQYTLLKRNKKATNYAMKYVKALYYNMYG